MNELQTDFIRQTVAELETLSKKIQTENPSSEFLQEIFRKLHSIKGTAQVFGLQTAAELAHQLEDSAADENLQTLLPEGFKLLKKSLENERFQIPASFARKRKNSQAEFFPPNSHRFAEIPREFTAPLAESEQAKLNILLENEKPIFVFEIGFDPAEFLEGFKGFRQNLERKGEVVASLPCPKFSAAGKIGFQIIFAANENGENIGATIADSPAQIVFQTAENTSTQLEKTIARMIGHGKQLAENSHKNIEFISKTGAEVSAPETLKLIFEILLHLVRNAVDHGIERGGKVEILIETAENNLFLRVSDDGKGLRLERIRARAIEKNLIRADEDLAADEITNLIFLPGFSTAETVSETSGRGIGLDAVKNLVANAGGKISVKPGENSGTIFEVFLPKKI